LVALTGWSGRAITAYEPTIFLLWDADPAFSFVDELNGQRLIELIHHVAHRECAGIAKLDEILALKRTVELLRFNATAEEKETKYE
jgi:hypothetical protein